MISIVKSEIDSDIDSTVKRRLDYYLHSNLFITFGTIKYEDSLNQQKSVRFSLSESSIF